MGAITAVVITVFAHWWLVMRVSGFHLPCETGSYYLGAQERCTMTRHKVKISVMKVVEPRTLFGDGVRLNTESGEPHVRCPIHEEGQEFYVYHNYSMPEGFCPGAWRDIRESVSVLHLGGTFYPWLEENEMIKCCTDGLRPVTFRLERLEPLE